MSLDRSIEAFPGTALEEIFNEANLMPTVELRYFYLMPLRKGTFEVKDLSHFSSLLCDNQSVQFR